MKVTIEWPVYDADDNETIYEITCGLTKGSPGCMYLPNGDPGYPPEPPECDIETVKLNGVEVKEWEFLIPDQKSFDAIADAAFKKAYDDETGAYEDWCDNERKRRLEDKD